MMKLEGSVKYALFDFCPNQQIFKSINHLHTAVEQTGQNVSTSNTQKKGFFFTKFHNLKVLIFIFTHFVNGSGLKFNDLIPDYTKF